MVTPQDTRVVFLGDKWGRFRGRTRKQLIDPFFGSGGIELYAPETRLPVRSAVTRRASTSEVSGRTTA